MIDLKNIGGTIMGNEQVMEKMDEQLFEVGETGAFVSDLFEAPIKGEIEKVYENSVMIRVIKLVICF